MSCCKDCKAWDGDEFSAFTLADCRRHAPIILPSQVTGWPETEGDDWCMEFVAKEDE